MVKIHISYTPDDEATVEGVVAYLKGILPPSKVKKKPGEGPYNHLYFTPKNGGKPTKYGNNT